MDKRILFYLLPALYTGYILWATGFSPLPSPFPTQWGRAGDGDCPCTADSLNCTDFQTHAAAQSCFDFCQPGDIHRLDRDQDSLACETLP